MEEFKKFKDFILEKDHPCLMAQAVFRQENIRFHLYDKLGSDKHIPQLLEDIQAYLSSYSFDTPDLYSFIAAFQDDDGLNEEDFEKMLWKELQNLHYADKAPWDPAVDSNPDSDHFSFSLAGNSFYVVGMHPNSSRLARKAPMPCLVFNLHSQFEKLRAMGVYEQTRDIIRERDIKLQGFINPMLEDFGNSKEAMQYSGRQVDNSWKCPFHKKS